jgi:hypothetical protein
MGPAIIFDKSALQSLSRSAIWQANSLFYTVLPDVLLHEILADLSLERKNIDPQERVGMLAKKISFHHACGSMHFRTLCVQDLLGNTIPMSRRPVVAASTGQRITTDDGQIGFVRDVQPENEAVLRWGGGVFSKEDFDFAAKWRSELPDLNSDASAELRKTKLGISSMEDAARQVNAVLGDAENHLPLLSAYMGHLGCGQKMRDRALFRWRIELPAKQNLWAFAPYTAYCLRVYQLYYVAAAHGLLPTKSNTLVDLEYFYHTPFAKIFCSSDRLHKRMAPFILADDQSFVDGEELKAELDALEEAKKSDPTAVPREGSLIHGLWLKHCGSAPAPHVPLSDEERKRVSEEFKPILKAIQEQAKSRQPSERFPKSP